MNLRDAMIEKIINAGFEPESYSGRGMFGKYRLGVSLPDIGSLVLIGGEDVPKPTIDSMGMGIIAYWPALAPPPRPVTE